jgi:hypothetical protein
MNVDELRDIIWEHLFQAKGAKSIDDIAALVACDATIVDLARYH